MTVWTSMNGAMWRRQPMETVLRPTSFPHFREIARETRTARAQRWRQTYKELALKQHAWVYATACWAFSDCTGVINLRARLDALTEDVLSTQKLSVFNFRAVSDPLEVGITYRLLGSSRIHNLALHSRSPSQQEYK